MLTKVTESNPDSFLSVPRENADGGRLAVQVEDKLVRIQNVKVRIL